MIHYYHKIIANINFLKISFKYFDHIIYENDLYLYVKIEKQCTKIEQNMINVYIYQKLSIILEKYDAIQGTK